MKIRRIVCVVLLGFALLAGTVIVSTTDAHAASSHVTQTQVVTHTAQRLAPQGCDLSKITFNSYWWGEEWYLPPCAAALAAAGFSVIPVVGAIGAAVIGGAIALSCNGSIYIDQPLSGGAFPRPAC